jgi:rubredoxin
MADSRECPLCGGAMRIKRREVEIAVPGNPRPTKRLSLEWMCPDCDYYEEAEDEKA